MCQKVKPALFVSTVFFLLASSPLWAQVNVSELVQRVSDNNQALRHYSWMMRVEVRQSGEEEPAVLVFKMRYDLDGVLQRTLLSQTGPEVGEEIEKIAQQAGAYAQPHPNKLKTFLNQASFWQGLNDNAGVIRIEGTRFLQPLESVTIYGTSNRAQLMEVDTTYSGTTLTIRAEYSSLPQGGPTYVARMFVDSPRQGIEIKIENFDYVYNAPPSDVLMEGTELVVRLTQALSSKSNKSGQTFQAILDQDVVVNGRKLIAKGTPVTGQLVEVEGSGRVSGTAKMSLTLKSLDTGNGQIPVETNVAKVEAEGSKGRDARRIGGATGIGALIGGIAGGGSGAAKGAAIGAAAGVGVTLMTRGQEVELAAEQLFTFLLEKRVEISGR